MNSFNLLSSRQFNFEEEKKQIRHTQNFSKEQNSLSELYFRGFRLHLQCRTSPNELNPLQKLTCGI